MQRCDNESSMKYSCTNAYLCSRLLSVHYLQQAAKRMVKNWEMRHAAFGEKAFEPMTLEGALSEDRETLQTGFFQLLQTGNEEKRAILLFDRPKLSHEIYNRDSAVRSRCDPLDVS